jgi:hypothetical protein
MSNAQGEFWAWTIDPINPEDKRKKRHVITLLDCISAVKSQRRWMSPYSILLQLLLLLWKAILSNLNMEAVASQ